MQVISEGECLETGGKSSRMSGDWWQVKENAWRQVASDRESPGAGGK